MNSRPSETLSSAFQSSRSAPRSWSKKAISRLVPTLDFAALRLQVAEQQLEQRGLAGAVRADQADLVAALDDGAEIAHQHAVAEGEVHVLGLEDLLARLAGGGRGQVDVAGLLAALAALAAHRLRAR